MNRAKACSNAAISSLYRHSPYPLVNIVQDTYRQTGLIRVLLSLFAATAASAVTAVWSQSLLFDDDNPPVPAAAGTVVADNAPDQVRVALVDSGVNYLLPEIGDRLARSSDGALIGYDFWDMDDRPFDAHPDSRGRVQRHGTRTASLLLREAAFVALVPYRYPRPDMTRMADLLEHAASHDVRIIGLPLGGNSVDQWQSFAAAARLHPQMLFIVSAGNNGRDIDKQPVYPASLDLDNMLVVTSADDFGLVAQGVNWGRVSVDYMVPAEFQNALAFDGQPILVSGSSYAVPKVAALAARLLRDDPTLSVDSLLSEIRRQFANGAAPAQLAEGFLYDPQVDSRHEIGVAGTTDWHYEHDQSAQQNETIRHSRSRQSLTDSDATQLAPMALPMEALLLDSRWTKELAAQVLDDAQDILSQCGFQFTDVKLRRVLAPDYLQDLEAGAARTLMNEVRSSGSQRRLTVVYARNTRMNTQFEAEAFGQANTRQRPWLTNSVWLTWDLRDRGIALAHELMHVLSNTGKHSDSAGNLMLARTTGTNTSLTNSQCESARQYAAGAGLVR